MQDIHRLAQYRVQLCSRQVGTHIELSASGREDRSLDSPGKMFSNYCGERGRERVINPRFFLHGTGPRIGYKCDHAAADGVVAITDRTHSPGCVRPRQWVTAQTVPRWAYRVVRVRRNRATVGADRCRRRHGAVEHGDAGTLRRIQNPDGTEKIVRYDRDRSWVRGMERTSADPTKDDEGRAVRKSQNEYALHCPPSSEIENCMASERIAIAGESRDHGQTCCQAR